ncbi:Rqc2 family fibronectin-binding protein [Trichloromonas sp.]|uniref:Rqc2 family fibronectin-binding protein n=1 Tax=Trichloromonas sp. TaxID=3069249 RepID=UPI003D814132
MSMDILSLDAVVRELNGLLRGAALSQIHQPGPSELVLRLWTGRENLRLLLSVDPRASRLHLTAKKLPNPQAPPRFCQLLRSRLTRLLAIERLPAERIVLLHFAGSEKSRWTLVAELLGSHANLVLLDGAGRVVDTLLRQPQGPRPLLPGRPYLPPAATNRIDLAAGLPEIPALPFERWLLEQITPMTPLWAAELAAAAACGEVPAQLLGHFREQWLAGDFSPCLLTWQGRPLLSALLPQYVEIAGLQRFASMSEAADAFYGEASEDAVFGSGKGELEKLVRKASQRLEKRLANIAAEAERGQNYERQRQLGDLLLANLYRLRRGLAEVTVDDWFADPPAPVTIPLDPALSPQENAEACFRRHRKGKRGVEHIARRRLETAEELDWLAGVALAIDEAETAAELQALRQELVAGGVLKPPARPPRRLPAPAADAGLRQALSPSGLRLIWGRNNRSNDQVSKSLTDADDLWFHAHNLPGCHLVLKREGRREIPEADIQYAAALAAGYSRGRDDHKVEVMVVEGRSVRKPKGARPGLVLAEPMRTLVVRPQRLPEASAEKNEG